MFFNGITSTGAATLDEVAFSGSVNLDSKFIEILSVSTYEETDNSSS